MNIRQTAVPLALCLILFFMMCFPFRAAATSAGEASFTLTRQSLDNLRDAGIPDDILKKLGALLDRTFNSEDKFLEAVRQEIGNDQTVSYQKLILQQSADFSAEIERISELLETQNRAIEALQAQNRALTERLAELEAAQEERAQKQKEAESTDLIQMEQRIRELETEKAARDEATRLIIQDAVSKLGSNINEFVALGGTLEVLGGWTKDFSRQSEGTLLLNTAEFDFEIQLNEWTMGSLIIEYDDGKDILFRTTEDVETGIDRINIDTAFITIGNPQKFPPFLTFGRMIMPFGISTGDPVADVLTIQDPLTIDAFEMRNTAVGFGLGFPTPALTPPTPPVTPPPVRPLVINPLISSLMRHLGYRPPPIKVPPPSPVTPAPDPPLFNVGFYSYDGSTFEEVDIGGYRPEDHVNATAGFRTRGNCGRSYDKLQGTAFCPWSIDVDVDYVSSIFDSRFLEAEYRNFHKQVGFVDGMAASVKATLGAASIVGEWNGAISHATFTDGLGRRIRIKPSAWQVSLGYQFDWNPWVEAIGAQGNYIALSYSESHGLAGVLNDEANRIGFIPEKRFIVSLGEWVLDNIKLAVEYSHEQDYPKSQGGTDNSGDAIISAVTTVW